MAFPEKALQEQCFQGRKGDFGGGYEGRLLLWPGAEQGQIFCEWKVPGEVVCDFLQAKQGRRRARDAGCWPFQYVGQMVVA